ncbi:hypothetical protein [Tenacibaculum haliotis]|uniref:hypothetical protein n=1 Tax=Tenacibaculum haliotis TaxID=1888914 RepID=UPI0021AF483B|nr:hypothetical protein [Tenacibaculum haliotis]MCT4699093.1 hypothetical protein [Tenacibaculum haliotis]
MKKILLLLITFFLYQCSNDNLPKEGQLSFKIQKIPESVQDKYNFTDLNVDVYANKEDYLHETNKVYSGKFNSEGKFTLSENIKYNHLYFIDIYTDDNFLSSWRENDNNSYNSVENEYLIQLSEGVRVFLGEWNFNSYNQNHYGHTNHDRTERKKLKINKDLSITSTEEYNNIEFTIQYKIIRSHGGKDGQLTLKHISTTPADTNLYPYFSSAPSSITINTSAIIINYLSDLKMLDFYDYTDEYVYYSK